MKVGAANATTTPAISVNGGRFQTITNFDGTPLSVGLFQPGQYRLLSYNGTNWLALSAGAIFNTQGLAVTPTNATLKAVVGATNGETYYRAGFNAAGDGGGATYTFSSTNCSIAGGDNGLQVQPTTGTGCWIASFTGPANAMVWGAHNDGTNGAATTAAINAALADYPAVYLPQGTFHVTDELKCPSGHSFVGAGQASTTITVGSASGNDFNMSANGVVQIGTPGAHTTCDVDAFTVNFYQQDTTGMTLSNIIQYPTAIDGDNMHTDNGANLAATGITITNAWKCVSLVSGAMTEGGLNTGNIHCSSYNAGLTMSGNSAVMNFVAWDQETFGLTANQAAVYIACGLAQTCYSMVLTPRPATTFSSASTFAQGILINGSGTIGTPTNPSVTFSILNLDSDGAILVMPNDGNNSVVQIGQLYGSKGVSTGSTGTFSVSGSSKLLMVSNYFIRDSVTNGSQAPIDISAANGAKIQMNNGYYYINTTQSGVVGLEAQSNARITVTASTLSDAEPQSTLAVANGGVLTISGSTIFPPDPIQTELVSEGIGGSLVLKNNQIGAPSDPAVSAFITQADTNGILTVDSNTFSGASVSAMGDPVISLQQDIPANYIANNKLAGWGVTIPFASSGGYYDINDYQFPITATSQFSTEGDFAPIDTPTGIYMRRGDWVDFNLTDLVTTNAYTTASGSYSILTNMPVSVIGSVVQPVVNGPWANVTVGAGSVPGGATLTTNRSLSPYLLTTGSSAKTTLGTTNVPPSTSGISFTFSGHYRVR